MRVSLYTKRGCHQVHLIHHLSFSDLQRAVELNAKLAPHVLQFVDFHFRNFFDTPSVEQAGDDLDTHFRINYEQLTSAKDDQLDLKDNLGNLVQFVSHCLTIFDRVSSGCDVHEMQRLLTMCTQRIVANRLSLEDAVGAVKLNITIFTDFFSSLSSLRQPHPISVHAFSRS